MEEIKVGISGINAVDNPGPGVGVARSLKEAEGLKVKVVGLAYDAMEPGIYMDWLIDKSFIVPYPSGGHDEFIARLLYIKNHYGLDFVFPNLDAELPVYIKYRNELEREGIQTFLPTTEQFRLRGKDRLDEVAKEWLKVHFIKLIEHILYRRLWVITARLWPNGAIPLSCRR